MVGTLKEADMLAYLELFKENPLTDTQKKFLLKANQGEFLLNVTRKKRLRIKVSATPLEVKMMGEKGGAIVSDIITGRIFKGSRTY